MNAGASSLPPVPVSPLGRGFAQLHALHGGKQVGERASGRAPFRHNQFLRVLTATLRSSSPYLGEFSDSAHPATLRSHGSGSTNQVSEADVHYPVNAMEAGPFSGGAANG